MQNQFGDLFTLVEGVLVITFLQHDRLLQHIVGLQLTDNVQPLDDAAEHGVLGGQRWFGTHGQEELRSCRIGQTAIGHGECAAEEPARVGRAGAVLIKDRVAGMIHRVVRLIGSRCGVPRVGRKPPNDRIEQCAVVERRFGLHGYEVSTLEQIGNEIGVTRERVRQIQIEAIKRLRKILEKEGFSLDTLYMES